MRRIIAWLMLLGGMGLLAMSLIIVYPMAIGSPPTLWLGLLGYLCGTALVILASEVKEDK
jgi:peptidoglycan/LPS O-acetylase OafA/YrhL